MCVLGGQSLSDVAACTAIWQCLLSVSISACVRSLHKPSVECTAQHRLVMNVSRCRLSRLSSYYPQERTFKPPTPASLSLSYFPRCNFSCPIFPHCVSLLPLASDDSSPSRHPCLQSRLIASLPILVYRSRSTASSRPPTYRKDIANRSPRTV